MVGDWFDTLLSELGEALEIKGLHPDDHNSCLVRLQSGLEVQIEPLQKGEFLLVCSALGEVPPGRYREELFYTALKANGLPYPHHGTFAYSEDSNQLILFKLFPIKDLTGEKVSAWLAPFMEKALLWKRSLEKGEVPSVDVITTSRELGGIFGLAGR